MTTFVLLGSLAAMLVFGALLWGALLQLGLRWAGIPRGTLLRATLVGVVSSIFSTMCVVLLYQTLGRWPDSTSITLIIVLWVGIGIPIAQISWSYKAPFGRAAKAWLPTLLTNAVIYPVMLFVVRPFLFEAFVIPTNGMAPTLIGNYVVGRCPDCGAPMYASDPNHDFPGRPPSHRPIHMICTKFHSHETAEYGDAGKSQDRIMAARFLTPRRWDLAVFRNPEDITQNYVKRVIGLPGETVTIRDGAVFIDGAKIEPPAELQGIRYVTSVSHDNQPPFEAYSGTVNHPAVLGPDEYFVLGDHTYSSLDSRFWREGVEGHPPYAVPKSLMLGVATHIYWPRERMRVLR